MGNNKLTVVKITGEAFRQTEDRLLIPIQKGDLIPEGEIIIVKSGQVLMMDSAGNPFELSEGSSLAVGGGPAPVEVPEPVALSPADLPAEGSAHFEPAKTAAPSTSSPGSDVEEDVVQEGHSHVRLGRIQYENNSGLDYIRDVNEVFHFDTRATRNPRVSFSYDYAEGKDPFPRSEIEDPYSGWDRMPQSGWANRPPSAVPGFAETDEDIPLILDLLQYASDPDGQPLSVISATALFGTVVINPDGTVTYTPGEDYHGTDTISYIVSDGHGGTVESTVTVIVHPVQDAFNDAVVTDEDVPVIVEVLDNDTFGPNAEVTSVTQGSHGTVVINSDGTVTYTPGEDYHGTDSFTYTVTTAAGNTETATVTVTVNPVQDAFNDAVVTDEDVPVIVEVLDNDTFGPNAEVTSVTQGSHGTVVINSDGTVTYTPGEDYHGTDSFTYTVTTAAGNTETATVTVTVNPVQDAFNDAVVTDEDVPVIVEVLDNDTFGPNAEVTSVTQGSHGTVVINSDGTVTYTPGEDYHGTDSFTYTVTTAAGNTETATVTVTVNPVQDAFNDAVVTDEDVPVIVEVLDNDTFGPNAEVTSVTQGSHGTVVINSDGTVTYTPGEDYHGTDSFTYTVTTAAGNTETATVTVTVNPVQDAFNDAVVTDEDVPVIVEVLDNDTFGPNAEVTSVTQGSHGTVVINSDGTVTYTPGEDYHGTDSFTYTVTTAAGNTETATVTVTVNPVQDAFNDAVVTDEDVPVIVEVLDNDTFGPNAEVTSVTQGSHGTVVINSDGTVTYTPGEDYHGTDSFTYTVTTAAGNTETATVTVTVNPVQDAFNDAVVTDEDVPVIVEVLDNDTFGPNAEVTSVTQGSHGTVVINSDGTVTYTPGEDYHGTDSFTYTVTTAAGNTETATVTVTVNPVQDAFNDAVVTDEDVPVIVEVLDNDTFGPNAEVTSVTQGSHGTVVINSDGTVTYTPGEDYHGTDSFTYTVTTAAGNTETATVTVTVNPVQDAFNDAVVTDEDVPVIVEVLDNDTFGPNAEVTSVTQGSHGTVVINSDGTVTYTPGEDYHGTDSFTYTVTTAAGNTETATVTVTVNPVQDAFNDAVVTDEDVPVIVEVLDNDTFGPNAEVTSVTQGSHGTVVINSDGTVTYTPGEDYHGTDSFTYTVTTAAGNTETATVTVTVNPVQDAFNDAVVTDEDVPVIVEVLDNDTFGPNAEVTSVTQGSHGTVVINSDGTVTYTPGEDYHGTDSFTYTVTTAAGNTETATVTVTVNPVQDAFNDAVTTDEDTPVSFNVFDNDTFGPNAEVTSVTQGSHGTVSFNENGDMIYTPGDHLQSLAEGETQTDTFTYTVTTAAGNTETATVTVTINGANDAPVSTPIDGRSDFDADAINHDVSGHFSDPDASDILTFSAAGLPEGLTIDPDTGVISGTIDRSASQHGVGGVYTVTVTATDPHDASTSQTFTWTVTNPGPTAINDFGDVTEDTAITTTGNVLGNDTDPDGDPLRVDSVDGQVISEGGSVSIDGAYGTVTIDSDGSYTYDLNNTDPAIQALAHNDPYLTDTFTYTITDDEGGSSSATLTIRIHGTNDAPVISVGDGDSDSASFIETDEGLATSGTDTLSLKDIDTTNTVETSVVSVVKSGESTYHGPLPDNLIDMLTVSGGLGSGETEGKITWTFDSGTEAFDFLPAGQKLILTYTIEAKDSYGDTDTHDVTITITGTNDVGEIIDDTGNTNEDVTLTGNVLDNDIPDPDYGESLIVSGFKVDSDGDGVQENYFAGDTVTLKTSTGGGIGTFQLNANGSYTFMPHHNYSGPVPEISYKAGNLSFDGWATLKITINPVADAPKWEVHSGVETNEDEMISLNFKMPAITDNIDENGALPGDYPERLGYIELRSVDTGAKIYKGDGTTLLFTGTNNTMTIVIVDEHGNLDTTVHYTDLTSDSNYGSAIKLTQAEFEALKILPPANRHNDIDMTLRVTSYETDDSGNRDTSVPGAAASRDIHVEVLAVTDDVDLKITGSDVSYSATIDEDTTLNLSSLLSANFDDLDGSEKRSIVIYNPEGNDPIAVNGTTVNGGSSITIDAPGLSTSTTGFPAISIGGAANISGDLKGITVTLRAQDTDSDSPGHTPAVKTDSVTLDLYVNPVAGDVTAPPVSTEEDTAVKFMEDLALTDTDGSEVMDSITIKAVPTGWVIKDSGGAVVHTGDGSSDYSVPAAHVSEGSYKDYTITPPAHSSADETLTVSVQTTDTKVVGGTTVTSTETVDLGVKVTVTPVAEVVGGDSDGDGTPDLTMTSGHIYGEQVEAYEDEWFNLNQDGFNLKDGWHNQDGIDVVGGTEKTFALLTPVLDGGSANGSKFTYNDGATTHTLIYNGTAVEIPMEHLDTVQFMAPENVSGHFEIQVQAKTIDTDPDDPGATDTAISGSATLANLVVLPVADQVTLAVSSPSRGLEDSEIALKIKPTSSDPSETFRVTLSGIPDGAVLKYGGGEQTVTGGEVTIDDFDSNESLTIQPPLNSNEDFTLKASAVSVDTLDGYTDVSASSETLDINVVVKGVPDEPDVIVQDLERTEDQVDLGSGRISLSDIITKAEPTDSDGSEKLTMTLTGLDPQFTIEGATFLGGSGTSRTWLVCQDELTNPSVCPKVVVPENYSGTIDMKVRPVTTEDDGASRTWDWIDVTVKVTPSPEATMALSTTTFEDTPATVNFSIVHLNGDIDEELSSVWIKEAGDKGVEGKEFTLYLGDTGTTLSAAAGQAGSGVVLEDGWYKLTGAAIDNVYAKGGANASGSYSFDVRYEVTDPSSDGSPLSVSSQTDDTYTLTVRAVTDATETSLGEFEFTGNASVDGTTVTAEGNTSISIPVTVTQQPDPDAGNEPDTDGSERLVRFVIDGVPDGVSVEGGVYIGDIPGYTNTGQWLIEKNVAFNGTDQVTEDIVFHLEGSADLVGGLNETITITAVTQDTESFEFRSGASWTLVTAPKGEFDDDGATPGSPAQIITYEPTDAGMMEDTPKVLNDLVDFEITGSSPFSITLTHLPPGTVVEGMTQTTVDGQTVWTASGTGGNAELQALLDGITVTPPENWNDNNHPGEFSFSVHLTTYAEGGQQHDHPLTVSPAIEPVTDPALIVVSAPDVYEGDPVPIALVLSNSADGEYSKIVDGKLYITLNESKMDSDGSLWYGGSEIDAQFVSGVDGITDGVYFVIGGVSMGETINLEYRPSDHASGSVSLTASLVSQEDGAANSIPTTVNDTFWVNAVNSGFQVTAGNVSGDEDTPIVLNIGGSGLVDTDGSESTISAVLSNVPEDFLVFVGADAESAAMAANLGGEGSVNSWSLPLDASGQLPAYVAILPPENWSGTIENIALTVYSGESSLEPTADTATFDLEVIPVADGVNLHPTLTFGTEGSPIPLNLNATMIDSDGSETVTLSVQGLGQYAAFHAGGSLLDFSYNSGTDTYTISGIDQGSINDITFIQSSVTGSVTVEAKTVETLNNDASGITSGSFQVNISEVVATAGNDTFLYDGTRSYDGGDGIDTLVLRYGEDIDFSTNPDIKNMEIIDLASSGYDHTLNNLSVQDVLDITDSNNDLWILGDGGDSVNIVDDGEWSISLGSHVQEIGGVDITFDVYTHAIHTDVILRIQQEMMANLGDAPPEP